MIICPNSYQFTGKELDEETRLYYYGARYYDAGIGRFMGQDPVHLAVGDPSAIKAITKLDQQVLLSDPQLLNTGRTMGGSNSGFASGWSRNTQSRGNSISQAEWLADPQGQNSYAYARNNPLVYIDPTGEWAVYISPVIPGVNVGLGGEFGNSWTIGFASDGTFGLSTSVHGGGLAGVDASINWTAGYSNAETWSDTLGTGQYVSVGGKIIGGGSITTNYSDGKYTGTDISIGLGARGLPNIPVVFSGGIEKNTPVFQGSVKPAIESVKSGYNAVKNTVTSGVNAVKQGASGLFNYIKSKF